MSHVKGCTDHRRATATPLFIDTTAICAGTRLIVDGDLDVATAPQLARALFDAVNEGGRVDLDLTGLTFADSALLDIVDQATARLAPGQRIEIVAASLAVRRLLAATGSAALRLASVASPPTTRDSRSGPSSPDGRPSD